LCINGIHDKRVQRLPIEMLHQEWKFKEQHFRKVETEMIAQDPKHFIDPIEILEEI